MPRRNSSGSAGAEATPLDPETVHRGHFYRLCQRQVEMSYSLPSRNVRFWPGGERGDGKVLAVEGGVAPALQAQGRGDGAGSEAIG